MYQKQKKGAHFFCVQLAPSVRSFLTMLSNVPGTSFGLIFLLAAVDESYKTKVKLCCKLLTCWVFCDFWSHFVYLVVFNSHF